MCSARADFFSRIAVLRSAANDPSLQNGPPSDAEHNNKAVVLRNGLAVMQFVVLEDFVRSRAGEVMSRLGAGATPFNQLPYQIQEASLSGALSALKYRAALARSAGEDVHPMLQTHSAKIASTKNHGQYQLSELSFASANANIDAETVTEILAAFKVNEPWSTVQSISRAAGIGILGIKGSMTAARRRRHNAAHDPTAGTVSGDLAGFNDQAVGIALGFDFSLSRALRFILDRDQPYLGNKGRLLRNQISVRTVGPEKKEWVERLAGRARAVRRLRDLTTLEHLAAERARKDNDGFAVLDQRRIPERWSTPYVD